MPFLLLLFLLVSAAASRAAEIVLPASALERDGVVRVLYRTNAQATGRGTLSILWTDVHGRVVETRRMPVELTDENELSFSLDLRRSAAMQNRLRAEFSFTGVDKKGREDRREEAAEIQFVARPPERTWRDYVILMWQQHGADVFARLKTLGINAGQYNGKNRTPPEFLLKNDLRWYAENIATDFYSEYHRWRPDRIQNWSFLEAKELYKKDPASKEAFKRHPSLSDPAWLEKIRDRLVESARYHSPYRPVFYSLADEAGIADLAAYWDFDFSDHSMAGMRAWLLERYGTLAALNRQWGTAFDSWPRVTPETTDEAMLRNDMNFSSWADHKDWMDESFARALEMGVDAVRSIDPGAYVGIGGAQMPGWGGYDYYRLSRALTAIEPYDIGNNVEIIRSLNSSLAFVTTAFATGPWEKHRVWYELLHGSRGMLLWDEKSDYVGKDGAIGARGKETAPYYRELRRGVAGLLMNSRRLADPIAIHYSQASMRTEWMLAQKPKGAAWANRNSSTERRDSEFLRLRESWCRLIEDLGLQYRFVAYRQVEEGELLRGGYRVLILPRSTSLSEEEAGAIRAFAAQGGLVIADGEPGVFDSHSRKLSRPALADLFTEDAGRAKAIRVNLDTLNYHQHRLLGKDGPVRDAVGKWLAAAGVRPEFTVAGETGAAITGVETHTFRNGAVTLVGLLTNPQLRVDELGPPEFRSNQRFEQARRLRLGLPREMHGWDIRRGKPLGRVRELAVTLDPFEPALFAFSPVELPPLRLSAPGSASLGDTIRVGLSFTPSPAATRVAHFEVLDPAGVAVAHYSGNRFVSDHGEALIPLAHNDPAGRWLLRATDVLTGQTETASVDVR